jgi:hypothetical protein
MTGLRQRCESIGCPGWLVAITWETGQAVKACSEGWHYDAASRVTQITDGGEISGAFDQARPQGEDPLPKEQWPDRAKLLKRKGWRAPH